MHPAFYLRQLARCPYGYLDGRSGRMVLRTRAGEPAVVLYRRLKDHDAKAAYRRDFRKLGSRVCSVSDGHASPWREQIFSCLMLASGDIAIYDRYGQLIAVVEIKNKLGTSGEWAAKTRRSILANGGWIRADFLLFVTPDRLYVWKNAGADLVDLQPHYEVDMRSEFQRYLERVGLDIDRISRSTFELLVGSWISDIIWFRETPRDPGDDLSWLVKSGFHAAVKEGRVVYDLAA